MFVIGKKRLFAVLASCVLFLLPVLYLSRLWETSVPPMTVPRAVAPAVEAIGPITALNNGRWIRSFRAADGTLYLRAKLRSRDVGQTAIKYTEMLGNTCIQLITIGPISMINERGVT